MDEPPTPKTPCFMRQITSESLFSNITSPKRRKAGSGGPWASESSNSPSNSFQRQQTPTEEDAVCEVVCLALKLPELPDETELDEVSCGWLRLRRASSYLSQRLQVEAKLSSGMWTLEDKPPTAKDLAILDDFYTFVMKGYVGGRSPKKQKVEAKDYLDDVFDKIQSTGSGFTLFGLRNGIGLIGNQVEENVIPHSGAAGFVWPIELAPPERLFNSLCALLRPSAGTIAKYKFVQLGNWIEAEKTLNDFLTVNGACFETITETSGAKLRAVMSCSKNNSGLELQVMSSLELLLDREPKASTYLLLMDKSAMLPAIVDMVLYQGIKCVENKSVLRLWELCKKVVHEAAGLGCPRAPSVSASTPRGRGVVGDVLSRRLIRSTSRGSLSRQTTPELSPPVSGRKSARLASLPANATSSTASAASEACQSALSPMQKSQSDSSLPAAKNQLSLGAKDQLPGLPGKVVKRRVSMKSLRAKTSSLPEVLDDKPEKGVGSQSKQVFESLGSLLEDCDHVEPLAHNGKPAWAVQRRNSIAMGDLRALDLASISMMSGKYKERAVISGKLTSTEWELNCCALLWEAMTPQSITYGLAVGIHSVVKPRHFTKLLYTGWSLLDEARAVECVIGSVGIRRLRLEMDMLADQRTRCLILNPSSDPDELKEFIKKATLTLVHLRSICDTDTRFAQVAVLYGVAFIVESMAQWSERMPDGEAMTAAGCELAEALKPHFLQLFRRGDTV